MNTNTGKNVGKFFVKRRNGFKPPKPTSLSASSLATESDATAKPAQSVEFVRQENAKKLRAGSIGRSIAVPVSTPTSIHLVDVDAISVDMNMDDSEPIQTRVRSDSLSNYLTTSKFSDLSISSHSKRALADVMKYTFMTTVQEQSIPMVITGTDAFVKAKTGTGKTLAFLIPSLENLLRSRASASASREKSTILIISPTRELTLQIAAEAEQLCTYYTPRLSIATFVGGTSVDKDVKVINRGDGPDIVIATPGRLLMHLEETKGFANMCKGVSCLILDEADRLLDMGFKPDIDRIASYLRPSTGQTNPRQTLLFSATFAPEVKSVADTFLRKGYKVIDTVGEDVDQTHSHVPQRIVTVPIPDTARTIVYLLEQQRRMPTHKVMVFLTTAMQTAYFARLVSAMGIPVLEMHSRKTQSYRIRTSEEFREAANAIMFTSDVTARGMDYPDVTLVIQVGMTSREQYIHRLGRTARAGKEGSGMLICAPFEIDAMRSELSDLPLVVDEIPAAVLHADAGVNSRFARIDDIQRSLADDAKSSWQSWLGFYKGFLKKLRWNANDLVSVSRDIAASMGLQELPAIPARTLGKMGLKGVPGLRVDHEAPPPSRGGRGGGGGGQDGPHHNRGTSSASSAASSSSSASVGRTGSSPGPAAKDQRRFGNSQSSAAPPSYAPSSSKSWKRDNHGKR